MRSVGSSQPKSLIRSLAPQIAIIPIVLVLYCLSLLKIIPSPTDLNALLMRLFITYGLPIIAISSFLENLVGINVYFPGAFTILTGMSLTAGQPMRAFLTYLAIYIPAYLANILSFFVGKLQKSGLSKGHRSNLSKTIGWLFATYWHP